MPEEPSSRPAPAGVYDRPGNDGVSGLEVAALVLGGLWLLLAGGYMIFGDTEDAQVLTFVLKLMVLVFPIALIWVAATAARASRMMREDSARLEVAIEALRKAYVGQASGSRDTSLNAIQKRLEEISAVQKRAESTLAMIASTRAAAPSPQDTVMARAAQIAEPGDQPGLALGTPAEALAPPLSRADFIRALHFPETAEDEAGFAALRKALKDRQARQLVQASQDILTLLSQEGIYMDDLRPDLARPEVWRAFAKGQRGRAVAALGGVRDRSSLALTAGRMKQDPVFRDAAHHFLRVFDKAFVQFEDGATDSEITEFAGTRTARAFMLIGRVAGTFD